MNWIQRIMNWNKTKRDKKIKMIEDECDNLPVCTDEGTHQAVHDIADQEMNTDTQRIALTIRIKEPGQ